ncbi:MAG: hypothetical protein E7491_01705 [Ruminococcaceae bacterium]|nr:hypothetical protein [Oscillospiraceae bacterium]
MNTIKKAVMCFLLLVFFTIQITANNIAFAFDTVELSGEREKNARENLNFALITEEPKKRPIICFDVLNNDTIAIGTEFGSTSTVSIYNSNGDFKYGYKFETSGSYTVGFEDGKLVVYLVRSDLAITLNENGDVAKVQKILMSNENEKYWESTYSTVRNVDGFKYESSGEMSFIRFFTGYDYYLVATDENGNEHVVYDVRDTGTVINILSWCLVIFLTGSLLYAVIRVIRIMKCDKNMPSQQK